MSLIGTPSAGDLMDAPVPGLACAFELTLLRDTPVIVGTTPTGGQRSHVPVIGGRFRGEGLTGSVVAGGETLLQRADGVVVVEANYYIRFADGAVARCFGRGYRTISGEFTGLRLSLLFEAAGDGSVAMLATRVYVAEQPEAGAVLTISRIT